MARGYYEGMYDGDTYYPGCEEDHDLDFANPGSDSALRATNSAGGRCRSCKKRVSERDHYCKHCGTHLNPRVNPCPNCETPNVLTDDDVQLGYVCDSCAEWREQGGYWPRSWGY